MLTRFDEEIRQGSGTLDAVWVALSRAGRVVFVSGVTLGLTNGELHASLRPRERYLQLYNRAYEEPSPASLRPREFVFETVRRCM